MQIRCDKCFYKTSDNTYLTKACPECGFTRWIADVDRPDLKEVCLGTGIKHDQGKLPLDLLPVESLEEIAKVLQFGKSKYGDWNWAGGMKWSRVLGACLRHLFAWARGESTDPETGLSHLAHAGCCILFLLFYEKYYKVLDDRFTRPTDGQKGDSK